MKKNIFYNNRSNEINFEKKELFSLKIKNKKINVDINKLLNRVKIDQQNEKKFKVVFFGSGILLLVFMGLFVSIVR
tara:strand:- start:150 stop:377 length:228 start_codon:yes stop_codon:yes gene_type:complete